MRWGLCTPKMRHARVKRGQGSLFRRHYRHGENSHRSDTVPFFWEIPCGPGYAWTRLKNTDTQSQKVFNQRHWPITYRCLMYRRALANHFAQVNLRKHVHPGRSVNARTCEDASSLAHAPSPTARLLPPCCLYLNWLWVHPPGFEGSYVRLPPPFTWKP